MHEKTETYFRREQKIAKIFGAVKVRSTSRDKIWPVKNKLKASQLKKVAEF
jgi:hypothetical protein